MYKALFSVIVSMLFILFISSITSNIFSQEINSEPDKMNKPSENCSFSEIGEMFSRYFTYYFELFYSDSPKRDWTMLSTKYKCDDVFQDLLIKEKKRLEMNLKLPHMKDGIQNGFILAYGFYIDPPYEISFNEKELKLYINNIQIWPLLRPSNIEPSQYEILSNSEYESIEIILKDIDNYRDIYKKKLNNILEWQLKNRGRNKAQDMLNVYLERSKTAGMIDDYIIYDIDNLKYEIFLCDRWGIGFERITIDERRRQYVNDMYLKEVKNEINSQDQKDKTENNEEVRTGLRFIAKEISQSLITNKILILSSTLSDMLPYEEYDKTQLMNTCEIILSSLNDYQKLLQIGKTNTSVNSYGISKEFLFHLTQEDCREILKRINYRGGKSSE